MRAQLIYKIALALTFLFFANQSYSQTEQLEIIRGQITDRTSKAPLTFANVFIKLDSVQIYGATSDKEGNFELKAPVGKYTLGATYIGFNNYAKPIEVQKGEPILQNIAISRLNQGPPWESSIPYPELHGLWKPITFQIEGQTIDHSNRTDNPFISFYFADPDAPGQISWNDGCNGCGSIFFRHLGEGAIECQKDGLVSCTLKGCSWPLVEFGTLISKMKEKETKTTVSDEGESLEISVGDDKFTFRKIHDNSQPELSTELHGTWTPVSGKLKGKKVKNFADESTITFGWQTDVLKSKLGSIQYVNGSKCSSGGMIITYRYLDEDFISFHYYKSTYRPDCCKNKFGIGEIVRQFSRSGCTIKFDESSRSVTLEYEGNMLKMKRI